MLIVGIFEAVAIWLDDLLPNAGHNVSNVKSFFILITPFFNILPNILISRLMLNLRTFSIPEGVNRPTQNTEGQQHSALQFATNSFLGNIGTPLGGGSVEEEEEGYCEE
ncbi:hypothetical protein GYMLUDRAFT_252486 [Collybiopsis luxurians FD-317 M1]|uniref:Uncharacterized protein n=1 Tax=Collybiopsis luxurians FD-317 M1 TaxID=944289 RepID=A0A0D0B9S3_9AGAR|nr:hypothetical protein GYMLUDRAFT_252486 [Collybiopsis luxurians FD-317 M1]